MGYCQHVYDDPNLGRNGKCGNATLKSGGDYCGVHSAPNKAKTRAEHLKRQLLSAATEIKRQVRKEQRERQVVEIKMLTYFWDGPGTEGRIV